MVCWILSLTPIDLAMSAVARVYRRPSTSSCVSDCHPAAATILALLYDFVPSLGAIHPPFTMTIHLVCILTFRSGLRLRDAVFTFVVLTVYLSQLDRDALLVRR